ncbi:hypothetical protein Taro_022113 [Colocasia esculenta]|uniref:Uncharacterized protein n=1 Tax=Colocasia esculenta TaxID=4460 RepID=A0A843V315_COLES|nr:hypothetical protein [Colocasia esculenta]
MLLLSDRPHPNLSTNLTLYCTTVKSLCCKSRNWYNLSVRTWRWRRSNTTVCVLWQRLRLLWWRSISSLLTSRLLSHSLSRTSPRMRGVRRLPLETWRVLDAEAVRCPVLGCFGDCGFEQELPGLLAEDTWREGHCRFALLGLDGPTGLGG